MKKLLTVLFTIAIVLSCAASVFADGNTKTTDVSYTVSEKYTWTVPTSAINPDTTGVDLTVSVTENTIESGKKLSISVASTNSYKLKNGTDEIAYEIKSGTSPNVLTWGADTVILSLNAGTATGSVTGKVKVTGTATKAGTYTDTLTFTAVVAAQ